MRVLLGSRKHLAALAQPAHETDPLGLLGVDGAS